MEPASSAEQMGACEPNPGAILEGQEARSSLCIGSLGPHESGPLICGQHASRAAADTATMSVHLLLWLARSLVVVVVVAAAAATAGPQSGRAASSATGATLRGSVSVSARPSARRRHFLPRRQPHHSSGPLALKVPPAPRVKQSEINKSANQLKRNKTRNKRSSFASSRRS